jgi:hypothetical protein
MTDRDDKSMDDVLASIRRIVRTEKESGVVTPPGDEPHEETGRRFEDEEPLILTPEMRIGAATAYEPARPELAADAAEASGGNDPLDRDALRAALRELLPDLLREELSGGPSEEAVRGIVRDELTGGQIGRNISQNVLRLIRNEVAKAKAPR